MEYDQMIAERTKWYLVELVYWQAVFNRKSSLVQNKYGTRAQHK